MKRQHNNFHILLILAVLSIVFVLAQVIMYFVFCMNGYIWPASLLGIVNTAILLILFIAILILLIVLKTND